MGIKNHGVETIKNLYIVFIKGKNKNLKKFT